MTEDFQALFVSVCAIILGWYAIQIIRRNDHQEIVAYGSAFAAFLVLFIGEFIGWRNIDFFHSDLLTFTKAVLWTCPLFGAIVGASVEHIIKGRKR